MKGLYHVSSSDPPCKDYNTVFTTVPLKPFWNWYHCLRFLKLLIFICGFSAKATCAFLVDTKEKLTEINTFWARKTTISSIVFIRLWFQVHRCESGIAIFPWSFTLNFAYSPFRLFIKLVNMKTYICKLLQPNQTILCHLLPLK